MNGSKTKKLNLQVNCRAEDRIAVDRISAEWRLNLYETIAAMVRLWNSASDEERVNAIRRPVRETVQA